MELNVFNIVLPLMRMFFSFVFITCNVLTKVKLIFKQKLIEPIVGQYDKMVKNNSGHNKKQSKQNKIYKNMN